MVSFVSARYSSRKVQTMMKKTLSATALLLVLALAVAGCSKKPETSNEQQGTSPDAQATAGGQKIDQSKVGSVSGSVNFEGQPPKQRKIDMSQDPACAK